MKQAGAIWTAGRASTRHRIGITTSSTQVSDDVYNIVHGEAGYTQPAVLMIPWHEHPLHDQAWYEAEKERDKEGGFDQEVNMDWFAGTSDFVYPETRDYQTEPIEFEPHAGDFIIAIDDGGDDDFAIVAMQYIRSTGRINVLNSYRNSHKTTDYYGSILTGRLSSEFDYDDAGLAFAMWLKQMPPATYYGDAHGKSIEQVSGESVFSRLWDKWGIIVNYYIDAKTGTRLSFKKRRDDLGDLLPHMRFADTSGAAYVLECLKRHKFKTPEIEVSTEQKEPAHTKWSHTVSALEYFAVQFESFLAITAHGGGNIQYSGRAQRRAKEQ